MIEEKETGIKMALNPEEVMWERERKATEIYLKETEERVIYLKAVLILCEDKLKLMKGGKKENE